MKILMKKMMIYFMWYPLRRIIKHLPLRIISMIGTLGGYLLYFMSIDKQSIMAEELQIIMSGKSGRAIREIIRGSFINYCISEIEVLLYPFMSQNLMKKMVTIEGKEHLDDALSRYKGVLLFQAHFGAFQMVMPAIGYNGYKMNQISASASIWKDSSASSIQKRVFDIKADYEYRLPVRHISVKSTLRPVFRLLKKNEIVGITVDGGGGRNVIPIRFLGRDANFQQGAADLAMRTGAAIVPAFIITEKGLRHRLIIHPPINMNRKGDRGENTREIVQEFACLLERYVYRYPTHYLYSLCLRKSRASIDPYPFFSDYNQITKSHY